MTLNDMTGRTALIPGSAGGIGMETARGLAKLGASVVLVGIDRVQAQRAAQEIRAGAGHDRVHALAADLTGLQGLRRIASQVAERHDTLDVLVNNVGLNRPRPGRQPDGRHPRRPHRARQPAGGAALHRVEVQPLQPHQDHDDGADRPARPGTARHGVTANVVYPGHGYAPMNRATPIGAFPRLYRPIAPLVLKVVAPLFLSDLTRSARSSIHLAASAVDERNQNAVWDLCARLSASILTESTM
ncbi:SDR family NAD(P)-dependent oxidoreductase [Nonomuraea sp. NPDC048881]|uniref:SDR family NAD(P)-dependent oxidoreductase n=1 Tax=Nonomuraea sp. NPDC048881 TaxID=3155030 RepID=UPI0033E2B1B7